MNNDRPLAWNIGKNDDDNLQIYFIWPKMLSEVMTMGAAGNRYSAMQAEPLFSSETTVWLHIFTVLLVVTPFLCIGTETRKFIIIFLTSLRLTSIIPCGDPFNFLLPAAMFLEPLQTQYVLVNGTATFHCRTHGAVMDVFWVVNGTAITISHPNEMKRYESLGFSFIDSSGNNLTINVSAASESTNSTRIFCSIINSNFNMIMSNTAYLYVFTDLRKLTLHVHRYLRLIKQLHTHADNVLLHFYNNIVFNIWWWIIDSLISYS